ncbi:MAG: hypothetical protein IT463_09345 [Planctomycetes bacterium]|nr:hypothetical protein [Planctomycetota bacterium]
MAQAETETDLRVGVIRVRVRDVIAMFDSLDPSPFIERDLDDDAVAYITSWAREMPRHQRLRLVVQVSELKDPEQAQAMLEAAVHNYFSHMADLKRNEFHQLMRKGRVSLLIGLCVLSVAVAVSQIMKRLWPGSPVAEMLETTVVIGGWVAMWGPLEIFLYDWWPLRRERLDFLRLRDMQVEVTTQDAAH